MRIDTHTHTLFSPDGFQSVKALTERAAQLGIDYLAITDHLDIGSCTPKFDVIPDLDGLQREINIARRLHPEMKIAFGIEAGFCQRGLKDIIETLKNYSFDYVINSVHEVGGTDCFYPEHFEGKSKEKVYREYLDAIFKSLTAFDYHAVGHLGCIIRNAPYSERRLLYSDHADIIDAILRYLIAHDKILELNSSTYGYDAVCCQDITVLQRYRELGGKLLSFGSDAHDITRIGDKYARVVELARSLGYDEWAIVDQGKIMTVPIT